MCRFTPDCQAGLATLELGPPPPAAMLALLPQVAEVQLSFQTFSGMYFNAVTGTDVLELQYVEERPFSLKIVPPTATLKGVDASTFTETGPVAVVSLKLSHPAAPVSPV